MFDEFLLVCFIGLVGLCLDLVVLITDVLLGVTLVWFLIILLGMLLLLGLLFGFFLGVLWCLVDFRVVGLFIVVCVCVCTWCGLVLFDGVWFC